jgi:hypothetical protein
MGDVTLSTGKVISLDISKVTFGEWRRFFRSIGTIKEDDDFIEKVTGLKPEEQESMLRNDMRLIVKGIVKAGSIDPNAVSPSTTE